MAAKKRSSSRKRSRPVEKRSKFTKIKKNKILIGVILVVILIAAVAAIYVYIGTGSDDEGNPVAIIDTSMGTIKVELYEDKVPNTVDNFIKLANDGFYDGLIFHRILDNFMIQGGGFTQDFVKKESPCGEISLEIAPDLSHVDGAISMARRGDPDIDSASSEFFICDGDQSEKLDDDELQKYGYRGYAVFGITIEGIDIVRQIASASLDPEKIGNDGSGPPLENIIINSITIENQ